jgi:LysR family transcriptional regulator, hydrogen peroxide-inducible genes activator
LELQQLRYFLAIAETGSFTAAASRCRVAQPSLSTQVAKLESELGGPLFERGRKGAKLTSRGELFRPRATEALRQLEAARVEAEELAGLQRGSVSLGCMPTTGAYLLPPLIKAFGQAHPGVRLDLREESSPVLAQLLRDGEVELAIVDEAGLGPGLASELLFQEPLLLAVPPKHPLAGRKRLALAALKDEPLILMKSGHGFRKIVLDALAKAGIEPRVVHESDGIETVQALVEAGLGLALVPAMVRKAQGPAYLRLAEPRPSRSLFLAWRQAAALPPAAQALLAIAGRALRRP